LRERYFLGKYISSLQKKTAINDEQGLIIAILNKLANPSLSLNRRECEYLIQKLSDRFEDACDCRNEIEINLLQALIAKLTHFDTPYT
jgi:hypothetical protein